jgi:hypothetical protein
VDSGTELVPTCNNCNKRYYEGGLGWVKKMVAQVETKVVRAEKEDEP